MAFAKEAAACNLALQFVLLSEKQSFPDADFSSRPHQAFPLVGLLRKLPRQQNLDPSLQELACRRIVRTHWLRPGPTAAAVESRREDFRVVEDYKVIRPEEIRKFAEETILRGQGFMPEKQQAGRGPVGKRLLGDQFCGKRIIELGDLHAVLL